MPADLPENPARSAFLALVQVHEALSEDFRLLFQESGLTATQFNVLRILVRGSSEGESCGHIAANLIHRVPDVTRLVDRMQEHGLVERHRATQDRRVVRIRITEHGRELCESLYPAVSRMHLEQLRCLSPEQQEQLDHLLRLILDTRPIRSGSGGRTSTA